MIESVRQLAGELCHDLVESVEEIDGAEYLVTGMRYWDGDSVVLYLDAGTLSDRGTTQFKLASQGIRLNESRLRFIDSICAAHGINQSAEVFSKPLENGTAPGASVIEFCIAISRIADLALYVRPREHPELAHDLDALLTLRVNPRREISRDWYHVARDPERAFSVDFRVNGTGEPRHIFHVGSHLKCDRVSAVCNFLKVERVDSPSLAVIRDDLELGQHYLHRLQISTSRILFGFEQNQGEIVDFALSGV